MISAIPISMTMKCYGISIFIGLRIMKAISIRVFSEESFFYIKELLGLQELGDG